MSLRAQGMYSSAFYLLFSKNSWAVVCAKLLYEHYDWIIPKQYQNMEMAEGY